MTDLEAKVQQARDRALVDVSDLRYDVMQEWHIDIEALAKLISLERAEAGLHWTEHLADHNDGMCGRCYMEGELEAAIKAILGE